MKKICRHPLFITVIGVSLLAGFMNLSNILEVMRSVGQLLMPVIVGGILALFLHVPITGIQKRIDRVMKNQKRKPSDRSIEIISFAVTILLILLIIILVLTLVVPEIVRSSQDLYSQVQERLQQYSYSEYEVVWLDQIINQIDLQQLTEKYSAVVNNVLTNAMGVLSSTVSIVTTALFSVIIAIYISLGKARLGRHITAVMRAYFPNQADKLFGCFRLFLQSFTNFLTGQCTEAIILGILMFLAFTITGLPYGSIAGLLTAICAIIPYVGALISGGISVMLTFVITPSLALQCLVVYGVVQFVENQFIYPRVVGKSVGLPPLYTLVAAMIGGKLFGIIGILFFIPLAATVMGLVKEDVKYRLQNK